MSPSLCRKKLFLWSPQTAAKEVTHSLQTGLLGPKTHFCAGDQSSSQPLQIHQGINAVKFTLTSAELFVMEQNTFGLLSEAIQTDRDNLLG